MKRVNIFGLNSMLFQCYLGIVILSSSLLLTQQGFNFMIYDLNII